MPEYFIRDEAVKRDNFTIIPNVIANLGLSVYTFRLYFHIKMVAGEDGLCWQSVDTLAENCNMSTTKLVECKKELLDHHLITVENKTHATGTYQEITINDMWSANKAYFQGGGLTPDVEGVYRQTLTNKNTVNNIYNDEVKTENEKQVTYSKPKPVSKKKANANLIASSPDAAEFDAYQKDKHKKSGAIRKEHLEYLTWFTELTKITYFQTQYLTWSGAFDQWMEMDVIKEDNEKAVNKLKDVNYQVVSPKSLTNTLNGIVASRKTKKDEGYNPWK